MLYFFDKAIDFFDAMEAALDSASQGDRICLNYFVIRDDEKGNSLLSKLEQATIRGAEVELVVDSYGTFLDSALGTEYQGGPIQKNRLSRLIALGAKAFEYHPIESSSILANSFNWNRYTRRNHNKLFSFVISGRKGVFTGDGQWANEHIGQEMKGLNVLILDDEILEQAYTYHRELVLRSTPLSSSHYPEFRYFPTHQSNYLDIFLNNFKPYSVKSMRFLFNEIDYPVSRVRKTLQDHEIECINTARVRLVYVTPYFCPDLQLVESLKSAAKRGVDVRVYMGNCRTHPYLPYGIRWSCTRLRRSGVKIYEYQGSGSIHYKSLISDNITFVKSGNGEGRSRFYNQESGFLIKDRSFADRKFLSIKSDFRHSKRVTGKTRFLSERFSKRIFKILILPLYYHHL